MAQQPFLKAVTIPPIRGTNHAAAPILARYEDMLAKHLKTGRSPIVELGQNGNEKGIHVTVYDPKNKMWHQYFYPFVDGAQIKGESSLTNRLFIKVPTAYDIPKLVNVNNITTLTESIAADIDHDITTYKTQSYKSYTPPNF